MQYIGRRCGLTALTVMHHALPRAVRRTLAMLGMPRGSPKPDLEHIPAIFDPALRGNRPRDHWSNTMRRLRRIRRLEHVRARRYATTGRIGLGLHGTAWAVLATTGRIALGLHGTTRAVLATTGPMGLGLHRTARAALRSIGSSRDSTEHFTGAGRGPDLVGPGRLTCYAIATTASADPRGIFLPAHHWD
jgi:hypothetical protein